MTIPSYRAVEPLYIIILRNTAQAEQLLRGWIRDHKIDHAQVQGNRLMLHDHNSWERFKITWSHGISSLTVWDTWNRRHIYLD